MRIDKNTTITGVFLVESEDLATHKLSHSVAIDPMLMPDNRITWKDAGRGRVIDYLKESDLSIEPADYFEHVERYGHLNELTVRSQEAVLKLRYLTIEDFRKHLKEQVARTVDVSTTESLQSFYRSRF